ncbi:MAG: hypothetical protein E6J90_51650 [Deltaproteobacteria bacterium]|nr:MAG: hypothetical protein E6J90_51650 [Deltaproteobacteria bacterium]
MAIAQPADPRRLGQQLRHVLADDDVVVSECLIPPVLVAYVHALQCTGCSRGASRSGRRRLENAPRCVHDGGVRETTLETPIARRAWPVLLALALALGAPGAAAADPVPASAYQALRWRSIGPFRGGRTRAAAGVASQPGVFYIGQVNGGVWKTDDFGRTWRPIFDDQPTQSIGAIAVAPSDPNVVYVGSGEGLHRPDLSVGNGIYKSTDAGKTWRHLGLADAQQVPQLAVDPRNPDRVFAAVLGHPYGPSEERGVYRSTDGGKTWQRVLSRGASTGASDIEIDPRHPEVVYAALWESRLGPAEDGNEFRGPDSGLYKSTDGGTTWRQLKAGLPDHALQFDIAIAPSQPNRLYAAVAATAPGEPGGGRGAAIYRSDDAGASWTKITSADERPTGRIGGGDLMVPVVDPKNPDTVYVASTVAMKSSDGGKTWTWLRGAPGGDDYQNLWINPNDPSIFVLASDQGAVVTVNGGKTWSSWYNQPTAQLYHVSATADFPYRVWRDRCPRVAPGRRERVRLRRARSAEPRYRLRRGAQPGDAVPVVDRPGPEHHADPDPRRLPLRAHPADPVLAAAARRDVLRGQRAVRVERRRADLAHDQSRPVASPSRRAAERGLARGE